MTDARCGVDADQLAEALADLDYPMFVVSTAAHGERAGCLVGFATQASIDPPRMLICISKANHTYRVALAAELLGVHLLRPGDLELARLFGEQTDDQTGGPDKFARTSWHPGPGSVPLLDGCRWILGKVLRVEDLGDHSGFLLEPLECSPTRGGPGLGYQQVRGLEPGHPA